MFDCSRKSILFGYRVVPSQSPHHSWMFEAGVSDDSDDHSSVQKTVMTAVTDSLFCQDEAKSLG